MTYMVISPKELYKAQDSLLSDVLDNANELVTKGELILAGGTALARLYLNHRISYDLDFFTGESFDPPVLQSRLRKAGIVLEDVSMESHGVYTSQLHGYVVRNDISVKISFVEDIFWDQFKRVKVGTTPTEVIEGLYHRKLRTITGTGPKLSHTGHQLAIGGRQKARDIFDLYVLDTHHQPLPEFLKKINSHGAGVPEDALYQGLAQMPWKDLMDEFELLEVLPPFKKPTAFEMKAHFDQIIRQLVTAS